MHAPPKFMPLVQVLITAGEFIHDGAPHVIAWHWRVALNAPLGKHFRLAPRDQPSGWKPLAQVGEQVCPVPVLAQAVILMLYLPAMTSADCGLWLQSLGVHVGFVLSVNTPPVELQLLFTGTPW